MKTDVKKRAGPSVVMFSLVNDVFQMASSESRRGRAHRRTRTSHRWIIKYNGALMRGSRSARVGLPPFSKVRATAPSRVRPRVYVCAGAHTCPRASARVRGTRLFPRSGRCCRSRDPCVSSPAALPLHSSARLYFPPRTRLSSCGHSCEFGVL